MALPLAAGMLACGFPLDLEWETPAPETAVPPTLTLPMVPATEVPAHPVPTPTPTPASRTPTPTPLPLGPKIISTFHYNATERVAVKNEGPGTASRISLGVALITSREPYQELLARQTEPSALEVVEDEYENQYAGFEFSDVAPGEEVVASLAYQVRVSELAWDLSCCQGRCSTPSSTRRPTCNPTMREFKLWPMNWLRGRLTLDRRWKLSTIASGSTAPTTNIIRTRVGRSGLWTRALVTVQSSRTRYGPSVARRESLLVLWRGQLIAPTGLRN